MVSIFAYRKRRRRINGEMRLLLKDIHPSDSLPFLNCSIAIHISPGLQLMYNRLRKKLGLLGSGHFARQKPLVTKL